ncbi:PIR Superfamily Protein [Plasmodium ovale curtisi]|uniref:PIR Superfamily Protein n=1 Tax=Plasmodium ovale curtisi TaxID=864141 RepID=A0A1A8X4Q3_PLAOA|nr:PIR Superfamily Protein [Plasmodium ovale curtisi]SBS98743.1 PIR Superfamily Protein [Plasmodium ovale curtisi]
MLYRVFTRNITTRTKVHTLYNYLDYDVYALKRSDVCNDGKIVDLATIAVCHKIEQIIKEWNGVMEFANSDNVNEKTSCAYLIYWLYDNVKDNKCVDSYIYLIYRMNTKMACPSEEKKNAYKKKFLEKSSAIAVREKVTVVKSPKETQEKANLLDYFQNFDKINNDTICVNDKCRNNYKYFENIKTLYNKHRSCCIGFHYDHYFDNCLDYFKRDEGYDSRERLSKLNCCNIISFTHLQTSVHGAKVINQIFLKLPQKSLILSLNQEI